MLEHLPILCPSFRCEPDAQLLGIVEADGRVSILSNPIKIDQAFIDVATQGRNPTSRFRFTGKCAESGCTHWNDRRCGVIDSVLVVLGDDVKLNDGELPACEIRSHCRWFMQSGPMACRACPEVITERATVTAE